MDLARAIAESPRLLILDEPFGGLDAAEREYLASHIRRLRADGVCVVVIDHVLDDLFAVADRVVAFDFGQLIAEGTPDTILHDPTVRSSYLGEVDLAVPATRFGEDDSTVLEVDGVSHHYGGVRALEDLSLTVAKGSVLGVVGTNGAGKSTLGRILHGSLKPSDGVRTSTARVSLVPEGRALFKTLSVRENLEVAAYASGIGRARTRRRLDELTAWLPERVRTRMDLSAGALSGGEQQLVAIARALMAEPEVLILDEPALGLSPVMVNEVFAQINALAGTGDHHGDPRPVAQPGAQDMLRGGRPAPGRGGRARQRRHRRLRRRGRGGLLRTDPGDPGGGGPVTAQPWPVADASVLAPVPEHEDLRKVMRDILESHAGHEQVRRAADSPVGYSTELWSLLNDEMNVGSLAVPEGRGGLGFGIGVLAVVLEEAGRALLPEPLLVSAVLGVRAVLAAPARSRRLRQRRGRGPAGRHGRDRAARRQRPDRLRSGRIADRLRARRPRPARRCRPTSSSRPPPGPGESRSTSSTFATTGWPSALRSRCST